MADVLTKEQRSYNMSMIKSRNTKPEIRLRRMLFAEGLRGYRLHYTLPGKPDIVFPARKIAIFIDGIRKVNTPKIGTLRYVDPTPDGWTTAYEMLSLQWLEELPEGTHTIEARWRGNLAVQGSDAQMGSRTLIVEEL